MLAAVGYLLIAIFVVIRADGDQPEVARQPDGPTCRME